MGFLWSRRAFATVSGAVCRRFESYQARSSLPTVSAVLNAGPRRRGVSLTVCKSVLPHMQESAASAMDEALS
jgi:hypothetical protein